MPQFQKSSNIEKAGRGCPVKEIMIYFKYLRILPFYRLKKHKTILFQNIPLPEVLRRVAPFCIPRLSIL